MITRSQKRNLPVLVKTEKRDTEEKQCDYLKELKRNKSSDEQKNTAVLPAKKKLIISSSDIEDAANACSPLPPDFDFVYQGILDMRAAYDAPVDIMGCDKLADLSCEPKIQRFHHLVAVFLSSQTTDKATASCMNRLKQIGLTVESILQWDEDALENILRGVSFHKIKAKNLKKIAHILNNSYDGDVPQTYVELCKLPGIGPKMALIALHSAWNRVEGIAVDVHVHRISNRLGWIQTKTPEQSCLALTRMIPRHLYAQFNTVLVGFGQQRCKALNPLCNSCLVQSKCPYAQKFLKEKPFLEKVKRLKSLKKLQLSSLSDKET
ncbi:endonuclease III-like protein 1 isoform X2 [Hylaeus volcanicus]|uniref:endonuclease III-like protein 1 isoform X2 n=1 Tax=Hylaeus volcanicus TaxID=313075 RepID=UPI0023B780AA|nr:endonuclease III-like protein 1 isoform X2 [Hylaeus volcanicus]